MPLMSINHEFHNFDAEMSSGALNKRKFDEDDDDYDDDDDDDDDPDPFFSEAFGTVGCHLIENIASGLPLRCYLAKRDGSWSVTLTLFKVLGCSCCWPRC